MVFYHVPGVSLAVINRGRLAWAKGYGVLQAGHAAPVDTATLFQAASISKAVTATAALKLVEEGQLSLDTPVNSVLHTWKVPATPLEAASGVTLRRLLSHTAGMSVPGYLGYGAGQPVPTLLQVLKRQAPATSAPVEVQFRPGQTYVYSGGGYEVVQLLMQDATGQPFAELMRLRLLGPLRMNSSSFTQPLPEKLAVYAAVAHLASGQPVAGRWHTYPELAAAGLWSTPTDLARWLLALADSARNWQNAFLNKDTTQQMLSDHTPGLARWFSGHAYGLGLKLHGRGRTFSLSHLGINKGYRALAIMYPNTGQGLVVMTNGENGEALIQEIVRSVASTYHWPEQP
ncbi:serine hydrolase domain-containing protein [Deinococcus sp. PESE-13]